MQLLDSLIENFVVQTSEVFTRLYQSFISLENLYFQLFCIIIMYLIFQVISYVFPAFKRLLNVVFLPFRLLHVYAHLHMTNVLGAQEKDLPAHKRTKAFTMLSTALDRGDSAFAGIRTNSTRQAYRIATAPATVAYVLFVVFIATGQILLANLEILRELTAGDRWGVLGIYIVHLYLFIGITQLIPEMEDYNFVILTYMTRSKMSPFWAGWTGIVFVVTFTVELLYSKSFVRGVIIGILAAFVYFFAYIIMIGRLEEPKWVEQDGLEEELAEMTQER